MAGNSVNSTAQPQIPTFKGKAPPLEPENKDNLKFLGPMGFSDEQVL